MVVLLSLLLVGVVLFLPVLYFGGGDGGGIVVGVGVGGVGGYSLLSLWRWY